MSNMFAIDPMLNGNLLWVPLIIVILKVLAVFVTGLVATMLMVWFERKVISGMQNRIGPNKAGPFGLLQTLADGIKLFFKKISFQSVQIVSCLSSPRSCRSSQHFCRLQLFRSAVTFVMAITAW